MDLLWRLQRGELDADVRLVASNHPDLEQQVRRTFNVPYEHVPVPADGKAEAEARLLELLAGDVDLVVLARYMQVLSADFLERVGALARVGEDIERTVLSRAVKLHLEDRTLVYENKTVVF